MQLIYTSISNNSLVFYLPIKGISNEFHLQYIYVWT